MNITPDKLDRCRSKMKITYTAFCESLCMRHAYKGLIIQILQLTSYHPDDIEAGVNR